MWTGEKPREAGLYEYRKSGVIVTYEVICPQLFAAGMPGQLRCAGIPGSGQYYNIDVDPELSDHFVGGEWRKLPE